MDTRFEQPVAQMLENAAALISEHNPEPKPDAALAMYRHAEHTARLALGEDHAHRRSALLGMASLHQYFGEALEARLLCAEALGHSESTDPSYPYVLYHAAVLDEQLGNPDSAERLFNQAAALFVDDEPAQQAALEAAERLAEGRCEERGGGEHPQAAQRLH